MEHSIIFICYAACVDDVELMKMRGGTQYNICYAACIDDVKRADEGETQYSYVTCADEGWNTVQLCNLYK